MEKGRKPYPERPRERPREVTGVRIPPGLEAISGKNAVREALRAGKRVRRLLLVDGPQRDEVVEEAVGLARRLGIRPEGVSKQLLDMLAPENQGLVALVTPFQYADWGELLRRFKKPERPPAVLCLDTMQDPQNLGTLLRSSEAMRIDAVVLPKRRSVHVTPAVVRSSAGAVEHLPVAQVTNLVRAVQELKEAGFWVAGIDMSGDKFPWELDMSGPTALVLGGEDHGIGQLLRENCDFLVKIPMAGRVNSLNAAVAGSMVLYEIARQRSA